MNGSKSITWTVQPPEAEPKSVKVTSEHIDKVSIEDENQEGKSFSVKGVAPGESTITIDVDGHQNTMTVTVNHPKGTVSAKLDGGTLTAGKDAADTKIKVTASGLTFASADKSNFTLAGVGASGLTVSEASGEGETVDLILRGTPAKAGAITVTVKQAAFAVPPAETTLTAAGVTVDAPTVTISAEPSSIQAASETTEFTITATGSGFVTAADSSFTVSGIEGVNKSSVTVESDGAESATLTIDAAPQEEGTLTIEVAPEGFKYQPAAKVSCSIEVTAAAG